MSDQSCVRIRPVLSYLTLLAFAPLLLTGCGLHITVPPITLDVPIAEDIGLDAGLIGGFPLFDLPIISPVTCNLPDREALEAEVRAQAGAIGGSVTLDGVTLNRFYLDASLGNFDDLTRVRVWFVTFGGGGITRTLLGEALAPSGGFGGRATFEPESPLDVLALLEGQDCGAIYVAISGTVPRDELIFDGIASLTIRATLTL